MPRTYRPYRRPRAPRIAAFERSAHGRLKKFRNYTRLAVAITAMLLFMWSGAGGQTNGAEESVDEAGRAFGQLWVEASALLPKLAIAVGILVLAAIITRLTRPLLRKLLRNWDRADAVRAIVLVAVWLSALAAALSVMAGNPRALLGSVGLLGLAASWALQAPIESFAGWLVNSFRGYYRIGDRIAVGDVFGDVYRIDVLTTTLWEAGGPDKAVQGAQPTGALVTFPNFEVLRTNIINYTRGFPYVWDEIKVGITNESDARYAMQVIAGAARDVVGAVMKAPAERYQSLVAGEGLTFEVATEPQVFLEPVDAWTNVVVRYLVPARERRTWASRLHLQITESLQRAEHRGRVSAAYPTQRVQLTERPAPPPPQP